MVIILGVLGMVAAVLFFVIRAHGTVQSLREVDRDTKGLQARAKSTLQDIIGTPLRRVRDVRLAAVILMIQLVRTGSPITAAEKASILSFMEDPLEIEQVTAFYDRAWGYTEHRRPFSLVADELLPLLREKLTEPERLHLVEMLSAVASAHSPASDLQGEALVRLKRRLISSVTTLKANRSDG
ncbi:MAG: TerB family tellurite resistance protein [Methylobacterium sp.]|uniref:TerB family tellurite resistance protein n=1 Tax=Methylobacterium sp. TaxID=409 RepID=UPI0025D17899|nr:TerB family tellurite resistance protein [Methylobacterium sp.]MBX9934089.1 TerB family tellurite resistance protein [Methylobacterium sp.]